MSARDPMDVHSDDIQADYDDTEFTPDPKDIA